MDARERFRVTHYAVRLGDVQARPMYDGTSRALAWLAVVIVRVLFVQSLDMVELSRYVRRKEAS